jgi:hypothetical protein
MEPFDVSIQILTHCDPVRALRACLLAESVPEKIEVLCAVNGPLEQVALRLGDLASPRNLRFLPNAAQQVYPTNALRNVALENASADWVFYVDCDFVFCNGFWKSALSHLRRLQPLGSICLCPIALWRPNDALQQRSEGFLETETRTLHRYPGTWREAQDSSMFKYHDRYFRPNFGPDADAYDLTPQMLYLRNLHSPPEPWGLLKRTHVPWADEDFRAGPLDKQQFVSSMLDRGIRFFAMPDIFIFHLWHPDASHGWPDRVRNHCMWLRRYHRLGHRYLLIGVGGVLPAALPAALESMLCAVGRPCFPAAALAQRPDRKLDTEEDVSYRASSIAIGPACLSRGVLGRHFRICVFFRSPSWYRQRQALAGGSRQGVLIKDGDYVKLFAGTDDLSEAISLVSNVALLCDLEDPERCSRSLRNLTGSDILSADQLRLDAGETAVTDVADRIQHPTDYAFYDFVRLQARNG